MAQGTTTHNDSMISSTHVVNGIVGARSMGMGMLLAAGAAYGLVLWVVGALMAMPARLGVDLFVINEVSLRTLGGHLVFGVILGAVVALLARRSAR